MTTAQAMNRIRFELTEELGKVEREVQKAIIKKSGLQVYQGHRVLKSTSIIPMIHARAYLQHQYVMLKDDFQDYIESHVCPELFYITIETKDLDHLFEKNGLFPKPVIKVYTGYEPHWKPFTLFEAELLEHLGHPID